MKVRTQARREAILEVASEVFLEFGYERASIAEIIKRIGGSKSTIYGYFPSKEALFLAVAHAAGERHMESALAEVAAYDGSNLRPTLTHFSEKLLEFLCSEEAVAAHRMVLGEAGNSDIGRLFYEAGPQRGLTLIADLARQAMARGQLRREDPAIVARYFGALVNAEYQHRWFFRDLPPVTRAQIRRSAERAVTAFLRAFALGEHAQEAAPPPAPPKRDSAKAAPPPAK
ncbi:TetR/AcrR family transcriptional regulator [Paracidovorax anthurii]|uniref:TetR family transcriptional regulator n=1 Tax=Paracidovorax anthurii TaxID=78229 RepID=A0A328YZK2_9BURK|nr:TetR/AcrR family transcriptional regulator [Paracidovorax anthurii]RAR75997.1 TetR family transcriptional regulator [Paracidovorax anthurii]